MQLIAYNLGMDKKLNATEFMTDKEIRLYTGYKKTKADVLKDKAAFRNAIKERLAATETVITEEGEVIEVSALQLLVDTKLQDDLKHPESIDLAKWLKVAGEDVTQIEANLKGADELFGDIVNKGE